MTFAREPAPGGHDIILAMETSPTPPDENRPSEYQTTAKTNQIALFLIPVFFILGIGIGYLIWGRSPSPVTAAVNPTVSPVAENRTAQAASPAVDQPTTAPTVRRYDVPVDDDPFLGMEDAAITLIEFSDYECPFCTRWHTEVFAPLMKKYPDQVRFVYRDFPLPSHPNAIPAAEAANCANEQGAFWEYHDRLFATTQGLSAAVYEKIAAELGLDLEQFTQCVEDRTYQAEVDADFQYAANLGVTSTPTFFLNGIPIVGAQPFEFFDEVVRRELAGEIP